MLKDISITEARNQITSMPNRLSRSSSAVTVTKRGKPVLAILPWALYDALMETLEIMNDKDMINALRQGIKEMKSGHGIPWEQVKKELKL